MSIIVTPRGIKKLSNTCYMNAVLQCLLSADVFNTKLLSYVNNNDNKIHPLILQYCKIITSTDNIINPTNFYSLISNTFVEHKQHCAHELIGYIMNIFTTVDDIKELFYGQYKESLCCGVCNKIDIKYTDYMDIQFQIPNKTNPDIQDCFKYYCTTEKLDDMRLCSQCDKKTITYKKIGFHKHANIAIFMFKRFNFQLGIKNNTPIRLYNNINIDNKYMRLVATINHFGSLHNGHYVAQILRNNVWYMANDEVICESNDVLNSTSLYVALYQIL